MALKHEEHLQTLFSNTNEWLKFAEAKNVGLLTLNAAVAFGLGQINFEDGSTLKDSCFYVLPPFLAVSFIIALISLFPILSGIERGSSVKSFVNRFSHFIDDEREFENIHYYGYLKRLDRDEFERALQVKTGITEHFTVYEKELSDQILYNSRITWLKYQLFKISAFFFLAGIGVCICALLVIASIKHFV